MIRSAGHSFVAIALVVTGIGATAAPSWEQVSPAVTEKKISSVENLLQWFATNEPAQLKHFTLMRVSQSIQHASEKYPRAIVFGKDGRFIFTFNGHPAQAGYDAVEILLFRDRTAKSDAHWELREIRFENNVAKLSKANPARCVQCHGLQPQPIWAEYDQWPGAYGKNDDSLRDFTEKYAERGGDTPASIAEDTRVLEAYRNFLKVKDELPRYRELDFPEGSPVTPFSTSIRGDYKFRPNLAMTHAITRLQTKVVADRLYRKPLFAKLGPALVESWMGCRENVPGTALEDARRGVPSGKRWWDQVRWSSYGDGEVDIDRAEMMLALDVDPDEFSMQRNRSYSYFEGATYLHESVALELYDRIRTADDPAVSAADVLKEHDDRYENARRRSKTAVKLSTACATLAKHRQAALKLKAPIPKPKMAPAVAMCIRCHDGETAAVWPENPSEAWRKDAERRVTERPEGRAMPPDRKLNWREAVDVIRYLHR